MAPKIVVVGSFVMDMVVKAPRRPQKGETILGTEFGMFLGGKGFNQAVACRRLGASVAMVGKLGKDYFGDSFLQAMAAEGIDSIFAVYDDETKTGVGTPVIDKDGDNSIIMVPGANMRMTEEDVNRAEGVISEANMLLLQLEVPIEASMRAAAIAKKYDTQVMLDPAPAAPIPKELLAMVDWLVPNEVEAKTLSGLPQDTPFEKCAEALLKLGTKNIVITMGRDGAMLVAEGDLKIVPGYQVQPVDTTGAGDAFRGALAVAIAEGMDYLSAIRFANACGALSATVMGAFPSLPSRHRVEEFLKRRH